MLNLHQHQHHDNDLDQHHHQLTQERPCFSRWWASWELRLAAVSLSLSGRLPLQLTARSRVDCATPVRRLPELLSTASTCFEFVFTSCSLFGCRTISCWCALTWAWGTEWSRSECVLQSDFFLELPTVSLEQVMDYILTKWVSGIGCLVNGQLTAG